ncbi:hypothetical protein P171DRAFT_67837 [Karstenula rhodostoma CBS 690.94]|uniref:Uncharacterized protein n=1 Tax=Karstenula rhodostoma CBS 690.94 TaxID=1392251 RepID=A0A9P4PEC8_9PLEO|nr:hypothetical protein P171DRAFT_67837 [Karstenula rhodostoma CBS 690.94]
MCPPQQHAKHAPKTACYMPPSFKNTSAPLAPPPSKKSSHTTPPHPLAYPRAPTHRSRNKHRSDVRGSGLPARPNPCAGHAGVHTAGVGRRLGWVCVVGCVSEDGRGAANSRAEPAAAEGILRTRLCAMFSSNPTGREGEIL